MVANSAHHEGRRAPSRGSVLLLVLIVVAMLTLGTGTYLELMQNEQRAVRRHGQAVRAMRLAESGVEYVKSLLALTPEEIQQLGGLASNTSMMQAVLVDDQEEDVDRGRVTILAPAQSDGLYSGVRYGLENESGKLNVNVLLAPGAEDRAATRLLALPGMTEETADAILDWLDADDLPRLNGAEEETYSQADPPYSARNGPIAELDELLLVQGVTPELLYGLDQNRNYVVDANEQPRGLLTELDVSDGSLDRGWSAYLTVHSVEAMQPAASAALLTAPVELNGQDLQQVYNGLRGSLGDDVAKFIVVYRQYGGQQQGQASGGGLGGGGAAPAAGGGGNAGATGGPSPGGPTGGGAQPGGGSAQAAVDVDISAVELKLDQPAATPINSPLDLVGASVQIPAAEENAPPQRVKSPWQADAASYREMLKLYDAVAITTARRVAGRVNINVATQPVLYSIPGLPASAVGPIVSLREVEPDMSLSDQRHAIWLLIEGLVTLEEMREIERYVTTRGDVYSGQAVGFFDAGPAAARGEFVVDRSGTTPRLRAWRELSSLGRGFSANTLGLEELETPDDAAPTDAGERLQ